MNSVPNNIQINVHWVKNTGKNLVELCVCVCDACLNVTDWIWTFYLANLYRCRWLVPIEWLWLTGSCASSIYICVPAFHILKVTLHHPLLSFLAQFLLPPKLFRVCSNSLNCFVRTQNTFLSLDLPLCLFENALSVADTHSLSLTHT